MDQSKYFFCFLAHCLFICGCTVNNYYTVVNDPSTQHKKLLAGRWVLTNCSGYDSLYDNGFGTDIHSTFSYDTASHIITITNNYDTSAAPISVNHYFVDSMILNIDSNGYYIIREAFSKNSAATITDSFASIWTYIWTNDSSSMLTFNPDGVEGAIFTLEAQGYTSNAGLLYVQSLDSFQMVLAAKYKYGSESIYTGGLQYERLDVRYTLKKQ